MNRKFAIGTALAGAFALGALVVAYSSGSEQSAQSKPPQKHISTSFSELQEEEIRDIIYEYLMSNPEVIIDAVNAYSNQQRVRAEGRAKEVASDRLSALLSPETGFIAGKNPDQAQVAVIELFDYHCAYCKRAAPLIKAITENDAAVKVVFRELPILREESEFAAEASLAAREQGKFLDFHFAMMKASGVMTRERVKSFAENEGLDFAQLERASRKRAISAAIKESHEIAREMGIDGTPTFVIAALDGSYIDVVQGFDRKRLENAIAAAKNASG